MNAFTSKPKVAEFIREARRSKELGAAASKTADKLNRPEKRAFNRPKGKT